MMEILYDWDTVKNIPENENINLEKVIPKERTTKQQLMVGRTKTKDISRKYWGQIKDSEITNESARDLHIKRYFSVCVFEIRQVKSFTVPKHEKVSTEINISHESFVRRSYESNFLIENIITAKGGYQQGEQASGYHWELGEQLKTSYSIKELGEYTEKSRKSEKITVERLEIDKDRDIIWWDIVKVVALYRESKKGKIKLLGVDDYLMDTLERTYIV